MRVLPVNPAARTWFGRLPLRVYVVTVSLLGTLLASYFLFVQPKNRAMDEVRVAIRNRETSLQLLEVEMAKLAGGRQRVNQLGKAIAGFESRLPRQGEMDVILREVWVIADAAGLKTQRIKTHKGTQQGVYKVLPIEMSMHGDFAGLYDFLLKLERLPGIMNVESLRVTTKLNDANGEVDASLVLHVFCKV